MKTKKKKKIIIVGAGISGLVAGAYIGKSGHDLLVLEKSSECGGLVSSFTRDGFLFDTGPRAIGNAGILIPMLKELGIDLPLVKGEVSMGIGDQIIHYDSNMKIDDYLESLLHLFPDSKAAIKKIGRRIKSNTRIAGILNKVDNPFFRNVLSDKRYLFRELLPWLPSFLYAVLCNSLYGKSVEDVLKSFSSDKKLNDMISQHFFKGTPANFAFGYFENFQDYKYPPGGTGRLPESLSGKILAEGGIIQKNTEIKRIDLVKKVLADQNGSEYSYDLLLWAADLKTLYRITEDANCSQRIRRSICKERNRFLSAAAGESVFTVFLAVNERPSVFRNISRGHFIYTPETDGLGRLHRSRLEQIKAAFPGIPKQELFRWLKDFCVYNSYEISIPVLKDKSLAPPDKTGLIISMLFDGELLELVDKACWYDEFKQKTKEYMLETLDKSIYPGLSKKIIFSDSATPMTLMNRFGNSGGAVTGWSLEEKPPVPDSLSGIMSAVKTKIPGVYKAGQWSYSPSGVPVAILTGRIAARRIGKKAGKL